MRSWKWGLGLFLAVGLVACSASDSSNQGTDGDGDTDVDVGGDPGGGEGGGDEGGGDDPWPAGADADADGDGDGDGDWSGGDTGGASSSGTGSGTGISPGTLTAGVWDDNLNFDFYLDYLESMESLGGRPVIDRTDRIVVSVVDGSGSPAAGATVAVRGPAGGLLFEAPTSGEGTVMFFPAWAGVGAQDGMLTIEATLGDAAVTAEVAPEAASVELSLDEAPSSPVTGLDVALIIDATGSMGDEMAFLKVELDSIVGSVSDLFPGLDQRWALVVYRDAGDEYVTRSFDFTSDIEAVRANLSAQQAGGGGDYPEAVHEGLAAGAELAWRDGATARVAFFVADAPHHDRHADAVVEALSDARWQGVHIYPIASSGVNDLAEDMFRTAAQVTGGRYIFLTDDSGVGGSHAEPTIPCYFVTLLTQAMVRVLTIEVTGEHVEPDAEHVLRTGGDPDDGRCTLEAGGQVTIY